jgi:branched-chain amino acid transport system substrate-binding protein
MRIQPGTYIAALAATALALAGCGGGGAGTASAPDGPLTVYLSVPRHGTEAAAGQAVAAGARLALADAHGHAGGRALKLVQLDNTEPDSTAWDPGEVEVNARKAAEDDSTIAYLGELDTGGSAVSIPVTNEAGLLQVSPLDGLTTLTRDQPGAAVGTGPARLYPTGRRTFLRLVPVDWLQAKELVHWAREEGAQRIAIVPDDQVFGRSLGQQVAVAAARAKVPVTDLVEPRDDPQTFEDFARKLAMKRPDAVIYTGLGDADAGRLMQAIRRALPGALLFGSSALVSATPAPEGMPPVQALSPVLPPSAYGPRARRVLKQLEKHRGARPRAEALYGYEAMRVVLDAVAREGGRASDRGAVARAALEAGARRSVIGGYGVLASGEVSSARFGAYRISARDRSYLGTRSPAGP